MKMFDEEQKDIVKSVIYDEWISVGSLDEWKTLLAQTVENTYVKDQRINIRISENDLDGIKIIALEEGIPYQTLIASIIHKYVKNYNRLQNAVD